MAASPARPLFLLFALHCCCNERPAHAPLQLAVLFYHSLYLCITTILDFVNTHSAHSLSGPARRATSSRRRHVSCPRSCATTPVWPTHSLRLGPRFAVNKKTPSSRPSPATTSASAVHHNQAPSVDFSIFSSSSVIAHLPSSCQAFQHTKQIRYPIRI